MCPAPLTVVGVGADGWDGLAPRARAALEAAEVLVGSARQLDLVPAQLSGRRVRLPRPLLPGLSDLLAAHEGARIAVLASGDPMFHGIGATLVRLLGADRVHVLTHPSSVSLAAARLGWAGDGIEVVSVVNRPLAVLHPALQPGRRVLVLVTEPTAANDIGVLLRDRGYGASAVTVLTDLGGPAETVRPADGTPHGRLAVVAVDCRADPGAPLLPRTPGLPDDAFEHDGQITKREIRAMAGAALAPAPGQLLWDVGAGSGSVGIEWMRAHPANRAVAVEPRAERRDRILRNATALGVPGITVVAGAAPAVLADLPAPDAVFVGGGVAVDGVLPACWAALSPGGRLVANAVTVEGERALDAARREFGGALLRVGLERAGPLGRFTAWRPALPVVQWSVVKPAKETP